MSMSADFGLLFVRMLQIQWHKFHILYEPFLVDYILAFQYLTQ